MGTVYLLTLSQFGRREGYQWTALNERVLEPQKARVEPQVVAIGEPQTALQATFFIIFSKKRRGSATAGESAKRILENLKESVGNLIGFGPLIFANPRCKTTKYTPTVTC